MINYQLFKPINSFDPSIRLQIYKYAVDILKQLPKGKSGLCGIMHAACCKLSYQGEISIEELCEVIPRNVAGMFMNPYYHMNVYEELYRYRPDGRINMYWWPIENRIVRLTKLRQAINRLTKKISNENQNNNS